MTRSERPRPRLLPLLVVGAVVVATLAVLPLFAPDDSSPDRTTATRAPQALSERAPFSVQLNAALAYYGANREFNLIDLRNGRQIGSKGVPNHQRPVGASKAAAFLGNLPAGVAAGNWDAWEALPWQGTANEGLATGSGIAYSRRLGLIAVTMRPLPSGGNGIRIVDNGETFHSIESSGFWSFATWIGDRVLVREATGDTINWWMLPVDAGESAEPVDLPDDFRPIAGTTGLVMGELIEDGVIIDLTTGDQVRLPSGWSWAADWRPGPDPLLATIGGTPATLVAYNRDGTVNWTWPLGEGSTQFRGGVSWSPDGSFVVAPGGSTIKAFTAFGGDLGDLDPALPEPESSDAGFVAVVSLPEE